MRSLWGIFTPFAWREKKRNVADARRRINASGAPRFVRARFFSVTGVRFLVDWCLNEIEKLAFVKSKG